MARSAAESLDRGGEGCRWREHVQRLQHDSSIGLPGCHELQIPQGSFDNTEARIVCCFETPISHRVVTLLKSCGTK